MEAVYRHCGYDLRDYIFSTQYRRIWNRVKAEGLTSITGLLEKVLHDASCLKRLLGDFSIQVTEMFRNPSFFHALREKVIRNLRELPFLRIWHAGCSSGEEVYSLAILLQEEGLYEKSFLYATDISEAALKKAQAGVFPLGKMRDYTMNYQRAGGQRAFSEYYKVCGNQVTFEASLQKNMVFAQHNLVTDGSFNEFHMIFCRNVLIYFNDKLQNRVHQLLYNSLAPGGYLVLGQKEGIKFRAHAEDYAEVDALQKIYCK